MNAHAHQSPAYRQAAERVAETIDAVAAAPLAGNEPLPDDELPHFFRALRRHRHYLDHCGADWRRPLPPALTVRLAGAYRRSAGAHGIAKLLQADFETAAAGLQEPHLSNNLREDLYLALVALTGDLVDALSVLGEALEQPVDGGAA